MAGFRKKNTCKKHFEIIMHTRSIVHIASLASCVRIENNHTTLLVIKLLKNLKGHFNWESLYNIPIDLEIFLEI